MEKAIDIIKKNRKKIEIIFIILIFAYYLIWNISQPFDSAPDEAMKYDICKYIYQNNKLPHGGEESIRNPIWGISYSFQPILSYMVSSIFMKVASIFTTNDFALVVAARLDSTLSITAFVYFVIQISKKLFKRNISIFICNIYCISATNMLSSKLYK